MSRTPQNTRGATGLANEATWYKDAIIYEVRTRSFFDSNGDGIGDFRGLVGKLDYLQDLGVTALWLLPFYPSPGRDDGYDISDYTNVHPELGTLADFEELLGEAHRRGLRVITELVLNHTSDQHPWFQRARRAPPGSPERDFYVWSDTAEPYREARIIFKDFEPSNWSWDQVAGAHYWHRFYAHQPDLNFENPAVHEALLAAVDFWLGLGVDGLRLDAVPYLYEAEGTNCENLPQTHAFLKKLRAHVDAKFENRMLLAEANQWPEDAAAYFGQGDECHMSFHFPLMPRMFLSIHMEDRFPIVDIFAQTPAVDRRCQWALFLRNHDELTLEMVTDEERDYMYRAYGDQQAMRLNLGIRRRLAPLVGNNRRKIELLNGLLFSLPGTPVLYYGDEIGMGDNVYLGDRSGVRTPMQWTMDRNAGFSRANPQQLILPVIIDPEYHYETLNVENQQQNPNSLLWWTKRLIDLRKRFPSFGRGTTEFLDPKNSRVLAFVRQHEGESVLVVANLSRFVQYAELDLRAHKGAMPVELFGRTKFPAIGDARYPVSLGPHGFYWFSLEHPGAQGESVSMAAPPPVLEGASVESLLRGSPRGVLDVALTRFLETRSWLAGRHAALRRAQIADVAVLPTAAQPIYFTFVRAEYEDAPPELRVVPFACVADSDGAFAKVRLSGDGACALVDACDDPGAARALLAVIAKEGRSRGDGGELVASRLGDFAGSEADLALDVRKVGRGRADTNLQYGERFVLRLFRRLEEGVCPELEIGRFFAARQGELAPALLGALELRPTRGEPKTLAVLQRFVPHVANGWRLTREELGRYYDRVLARSRTEAVAPVPTESPLLLAGREPPPLVAQMIGNYRDTAARLGARLAALHLALAEYDGNPAFAPEPYSTHDRRSKYQSLRTLTGKVLRLLREQLPALSARAQREAEAVLAREGDILKSLEPLHRAKHTSLRIRTHGNLHLGNVLYTGKDFVFIDFNGYPELTLSERRRKRSPLRDLAWMVRSFEVAALRFLFNPDRVREADVEAARPWAMHWAAWVSASFLQAYLTATAGSPIVPAAREEASILFDAFVLERTLYQLRTELEERSDSVTIALLGLHLA